LVAIPGELDINDKDCKGNFVMFNSLVRILPTGHASAIEAPEVFNQAVLEFINQL
jgi:pimeloyl-ACP methyl ester carboxylesterase